MGAILKDFSGNLNTDDSLHKLPKGDYIDASAITHDAEAQNADGDISNIVGNQLVNYNFRPGTTNICIGAYADAIRNNVIEFIWNNQGYHSILKYDRATNTRTKIFESRTDSNDIDILNLQLLYKVNSINVIHRDEEGDLLLWNDAYNRPGQINITEFEDGLYGNLISDDLIRLARIPPLDEPLPVYGSDATIKVNNLRKKLFQFAYAWVYKNGELSTLSPISKVPLPADAYNVEIDSDPSKNNYISVKIVGGGADYQSIRLFVRESLGTTYSNWLIVDTLDRDDYNIPPGTTYNYLFYNDGQYITADQLYTDLLWDYVADRCNAQTLVNGNVIVQGGILSGYDQLLRSNINVVLSASPVPTQGNNTTPSNPTISYTIYNTFIEFIIGNSVQVGDFYRIKFNFQGNPAIPPYLVDVSYTAVLGDTASTVANYFVAQIQAQASAQYSNVTTNHNGNPTHVAFQIVTSIRSYTNVLTIADPPLKQLGGSPTWKWNEKIRFGLVYVDKYGKSNGVVSFVTTESDPTDFSVTMPDFSIDDSSPTPNYNPKIPIVNASINSLPPDWAESFYWVRTTNQSVSYFMQYITAETDTDGNYHYFCIENLDTFKEQNSGFVPSYTFQSGDRVRVYAEVLDASPFYTIPPTVNDYEILGEVEMAMTGGSTNGRFLKVKKSSSSATYGERLMIEIYRPSIKSDNENEVFYAFGESYGIYTDLNTGIRYHLGEDQNQDASQPATFTFEDGDAYYKFRDFYELNTSTGKIDPDSIYSRGVMDANYNDFWASAVNSNGAPWVINANAKRLFNPVEIRFGQAYQPGTNINGLNRFYEGNYDEYFRDYGAIMAFSIRDKLLHVYQKLKVGRVPIYGQIVKDQSGQEQVYISDKLLNPIQYYSGNYGVGDHPESLATNNFTDYFCTNIRGVIARLSQDGISPLSILFNMNSFAVKELGGRDFNYKVYGGFASFNNLYIIALEEMPTSSAKTLVWNEQRNGFETFLPYKPEMMADLNQLFITWKDGQLYTHDNPAYNTFFGQVYDSTITPVFNENPMEKKTWMNMTQAASTVWDVPEIITQFKPYNGNPQTSNLVVSDFEYLEGTINANFRADATSIGGIGNGQSLKGLYMIAKLRAIQPTDLTTLSFVGVEYKESNKNLKNR